MYTKYDKTTFVVIFKSRNRGPLFVHKVIGVKTGKTLIIEYIAKDDQVHRHKYNQKSVFFRELTPEQEFIYKEQLKGLNEHLHSSSAVLPAVSYKGSGIH